MIFGSDFEHTTQEAFEEFVRLGEVRSVTVLFTHGYAAISFTLDAERWGYILSKRGALKRFRAETTLGFIGDLGIKRATVLFKLPEELALDFVEDPF